MRILKYKKIKEGKGDFESFNVVALQEAFIALLGNQKPDGYTEDRWYINTNKSPGNIVLMVEDDTLDISGVDKVIKDHFKKDWTDYDPEAERKQTLMDRIDAATTLKSLKDILKEELK